MGNIKIRPATYNDLDIVFDLIREFSIFIQTPEKVLTTAEQMKEDSDLFKCIVAELDGQIIGFATYFFAYYSWSGKTLYLDDLYVVDEYRGKTAGTMLLDTIFDLAKRSNCRKVRWQVSKWNEKAIDFYKKRGAGIDDVEINCDLLL